MQHHDDTDRPGLRDARESEVDLTGHHVISEAENRKRIAADMRRRLGRGVAIGGLLLALALLVAIGIRVVSRAKADASLAAATKESAALDVAVTTPALQASPYALVLPADTQAYIDTPIYARTNGYLKKWYADIGAYVHKGQLLAVIESPEVDQEVDQARSNLATARANLQIARITAERWKRLLVKNAVSQQETDQNESNLKTSESALAAAKANLGRLEQLQGFERVIAPFSGIITQRNVDIGSLIQAGNSNTPQAQLFHLDAINRLRLYVPVPEVYVSDIHNGDRVEVTADAYPNEKFYGTVARNSQAINLQTRTLNVEVDVENPGHKLLPGQYAFVHFMIPPSKSAVMLPSNTLLFRTHGLRVGVVRNGKVQLVPVRIGHDYGAKVEIISGLQPQDKVILNPPDSLAEGEPVRIVKGLGS